MDKANAIDTLKYLVDKYVSDVEKKNELIDLLNSPNLPRPPVRGVIDDLYNFKSKAIENSDRDKIDDLMYYFG